jgi:hypothetical protein
VGPPGGEVNLAEEPLATESSGMIRPEDLEGDGRVVHLVLGRPDRGRPPRGELATEPVVVLQCDARVRLNRSHGAVTS